MSASQTQTLKAAQEKLYGLTFDTPEWNAQVLIVRELRAASFQPVTVRPGEVLRASCGRPFIAA